MPSTLTWWTAIVGDLIIAAVVVLFCSADTNPAPDVLLDQRDAVAEWNYYNPPLPAVDVDISQRDKVIHAHWPSTR